MDTDQACFVGQSKGEYCSHNEDGTPNLNVVDVSECNNDITMHIEQYISSSNKEETIELLKTCPDYNESFIIKNRAQIQNPSTTKICEKHRSELGINFRRKYMSCKFPTHKAKRSHQSQSSSSSFRAIPLSTLQEVMVVHPEVDAVIGSVWCSNCRLKKYQMNTLKSNIPARTRRVHKKSFN